MGSGCQMQGKKVKGRKVRKALSLLPPPFFSPIIFSQGSNLARSHKFNGY
jgi:hypothetical protein